MGVDKVESRLRPIFLNHLQHRRIDFPRVRRIQIMRSFLHKHQFRLLGPGELRDLLACHRRLERGIFRALRTVVRISPTPNQTEPNRTIATTSPMCLGNKLTCNQ